MPEAAAGKDKGAKAAAPPPPAKEAPKKDDKKGGKGQTPDDEALEAEKLKLEAEEQERARL